jgi:hypothetical protein
MDIARGVAAPSEPHQTAETTIRISEGGVVTAIISLLAVIFSAYSLYDTSVRRPDIRAFVPPVIRYSSPENNSNFEVFEVPVTLVNLGAREGTVLSMDLKVVSPRTHNSKLFYSADFGRWTMDNARAGNFRAFSPMSVAGKASASETILFFSRDEEAVQQIAEDQGPYEFMLTLNTAFPHDLGVLDTLWLKPPPPVTFTMQMPEIDHRVFNTGTLPLHAPDWKAAQSAVN